MRDTDAHANGVLEDTTYVVLATASEDGHPWATPVWFAHDGLDRLYWVSWPGSRHSRFISRRPEIGLTVFDTHAVPNQGTAFYAVARAHECADDELDGALEVFSRRAGTQGLGEFTREHVSGDARLRMYVADVTEAWVLDQDAEVDQRAPVSR